MNNRYDTYIKKLNLEHNSNLTWWVVFNDLVNIAGSTFRIFFNKNL